MGTNYYGKLIKPKKRIVKDYQEFHIGKSSCGWKFIFRDNEHFHNYKEFKDFILNNKEYKFYNEYDEEISGEELLKLVDSKQSSTNCQYDYEGTENRAGYAFSTSDFS